MCKLVRSESSHPIVSPLLGCMVGVRTTKVPTNHSWRVWGLDETHSASNQNMSMSMPCKFDQITSILQRSMFWFVS